MAFLQQWLLRVVVCAAIVGFSREMVRDGATAEAVRFCGGLVLLLCLLQPLGQWEAESLSAGKENLRHEAALLQEKYQNEQNDFMARSIAERTEAYIEDKAIEFGQELHVSVEMRNEEGVPMPFSVELFGPYNASLSLWIEKELGILPQRQEWRPTE